MRNGKKNVALRSEFSPTKDSPTMKILPSLGLITLCAAFAGCAATTQDINFVSSSPAQDGITVVCDGKEIGTTPFVYEIERSQQPVVLKLEFKKSGYRTEESILESMEDVDGLCSFIDEVPVPELLAEESSATEEPAVAEEPAPEPVSAVAEEPATAEEPAPEPAAEEPVPAEEEPVATEEPVPAEEPADVAVPEEPAHEPDPAPEPEEPATEDPSAEEPEPAPEPAAEEPAPEPVAEPEATTSSEGGLDRNRTLVDIQNDLKSYTEQRQSGQISEKEFKERCAALEKEVRLRYGSK